MKKTTAILLLLSTTALLSIYVGCGPNKTDKPAGEASSILISRLPNNVLQSCTVSLADFNSWFASGKATENGLVVPANSITFGHNNNCDFYKWSWQMFSWLTSPLSAGGSTVMESPAFYTVSPVNSSGNRTLIPHTPGQPLNVSGSIPQNGPHDLPTILDKQGRLFEVEKPAANVRPMLLKGTQRTLISQVDIDASGKPVFKDQAGKVIDKPKALLATKGNTKNIVQEFKASNGKFVFLDANGNVIETEEGQAGGNHGLIAQNGSLLYYITMVNDVFAWYLSGAKNGVIADSLQFPITAQARDSICAVARANGVTLPDSNALAMEIKTSWIEVSNLPDPGNYVTINAVIPTYKKTDSLWIPIGSQTVKLALLGMHVVGSTAGHPEMVWSTFEHKRNSPNATFQYLNTDSVVVNVPQDSSGKWTLSSNGRDPSPNQPHFTADTNKLIATPGFTISSSNSLMINPWGTAPNVSPNKEDGSSAASNSEVISINNSVLVQLIGNDIRKNYMMIGSTWTAGGAAPTGASYSTNPTDPGAAIGTSLLANITMETYKQSIQTSCFSCHSAFPTPNLLPGNLSHVYDGIKPLISSPTNKSK